MKYCGQYIYKLGCETLCIMHDPVAEPLWLAKFTYNFMDYH